MKTAYNLRSIAAQAISQVLDKGLSLSTVLPGLQKNISDKDRGVTTRTLFRHAPGIASTRMVFAATDGETTHRQTANPALFAHGWLISANTYTHSRPCHLGGDR